MAEERIFTLLENAAKQVKELEDKYHSVEKEIGELRIENWNLKQENEKLNQEIKRWKDVAFQQK